MRCNLETENEALRRWPWRFAIVSVKAVVRECGLPDFPINQATSLLRTLSEAMWNDGSRSERDPLTLLQFDDSETSLMARRFLEAVLTLGDKALDWCMLCQHHSDAFSCSDEAYPLLQSREMRALLWYSLAQLAQDECWTLSHRRNPLKTSQKVTSSTSGAGCTRRNTRERQSTDD